jgi:hypothetical protein
MGEVPTEIALSKYKAFMQEIKFRTDVIVRTVNTYRAGNSLTGFRESDIELCLLQLRKCLELVMFASLVAHYHSGVKLQQRLVEGEWNATKILALINRVNPKGYPDALTRVKKDGKEIDDMEKVDGALTREEFGKLYDRVCGSYLHASRNSEKLSDHASLFQQIETWLKKLTLLLNSHWIHVDDRLVFAVLMQTDLDGDVQVALFEKRD